MAIDLHEKYQVLFKEHNCRYIIVTGGRGSSKSFSISTYLTNLLCSSIKQLILFTRFTMTAAHLSIIPEFKEKIELLGLEDHFNVNLKDVRNNQTKNDIIFRGIKTSSGNQTASLKSIQGITVWVLDEAEELIDVNIFDTIDYSIRAKDTQNLVILIMNPTHKKHWIYQRFFNEMSIKCGFNGIKDDVLYIHTTYLDNIKNLSASFLKNVEKMKKVNYKKFLHIFMGEWADETEGALWKQSTMIDPYRVLKAPELKRIVVAVDPSVSSTGKQDECGIGAVGIGFNNEYYVLKDASGLFTPAEWGKITVAQYKNYQADNVVAEVNQGGDLVKMNIQNIDNTVPVKMVRATRGKLTRAEPIQALYEEGKVHHVGRFYDLEMEMTTYTGVEASPNRLDWLVWGLTELSQNNKRVGIRFL